MYNVHDPINDLRSTIEENLEIYSSSRTCLSWCSTSFKCWKMFFKTPFSSSVIDNRPRRLPKRTNRYFLPKAKDARLARRTRQRIWTSFNRFDSRKYNYDWSVKSGHLGCPWSIKIFKNFVQKWAIIFNTKANPKWQSRRKNKSTSWEKFAKRLPILFWICKF